MQEPTLGFPELDILAACDEAVRRQQEIVPLLAAHLGVPPEGVWYHWAFRRCQQSGEVRGGPWRYFFHGFECDIWHPGDGRFLRIDFGPRGRLDTFTAWGVLQFIMTSAAPWTDHAPLRRLFASSEGEQRGSLAGDLHRFLTHWDRLEAHGCYEVADPALVEFQRRHTTGDPGGIQYIRFPDGTPEEVHADCSVANRKHLSAHARRLLAALTASPPAARPPA